VLLHGLTDSPYSLRHIAAHYRGHGFDLPAGALTRAEGQPAVWVVDPRAQTVALRAVEVLRFDPGRVLVGQGLAPGEVVVTAGVQALRPGQKVRLLGAAR